jgi:uncharacterized protein (DUF1499 family)
MPALGFEGGAEPVRRAIVALLETTPRVKVVEAAADYVHAEMTTPLFRFVDDVEFLIDSEGRRVHYRSASRVGRWDLGTNRRRMKKLCRELCRQPGIFTL